MRHWDQGGRVPVLALHCSLAHSGAFAGLAGALRGVRVHAPDLIGHGRAPDWDGVSDLHGLATARVRDELAGLATGGPVHLIGHSFGGTIALRLAVEAPELVRSLTLVEPVLFAAARGTMAWEGFAQSYQPFQAALARGDRDGAALAFLEVWGGPLPFARMPAEMQAYIRARIHLVAAQDGALNDDSAGLLAPGRLEATRVPVLIAEGAVSPPVIGVINGALAARLPDARRLVVPGAGHMLPLTHPAPLAQAVMALWAGA